MTHDHVDTLNTFTTESLPDLDVVVLGALEMFAQTPPPELPDFSFKRPVVVGSGNAAPTGRIIFDDADAVFADESDIDHKIATIPSIDGAVLISASGGKHAVPISQSLKEKGIPVTLLTHNANAPARTLVSPERFLVFPKNREPYTYNTSTYLGLMLGKTHDNVEELHNFITSAVVAALPENLGAYSAYCLVVPGRFTHSREMLRTKFDELFGSYVCGRVFTQEETKHARTIEPSPKELFITFGEANIDGIIADDVAHIHIPLPEHATYVSMIAIGYYVVGRIQAVQQPWFKQFIGAYCERNSRVFGQTIAPIVE